jgi:hypothetical protein
VLPRAFPCSRWLRRFYNPFGVCKWQRRNHRACKYCSSACRHPFKQFYTKCAANQYSVRKLFDLAAQSKQDSSVLPEAQQLQGIVGRADFTIAKASIAGTKFLIEKLYGYGGRPRKPLPPIDADVAQALWEHPHTQDLIKTERQLSGQ